MHLMVAYARWCNFPLNVYHHWSTNPEGSLEWRSVGSCFLSGECYQARGLSGARSEISASKLLWLPFHTCTCNTGSMEEQSHSFALALSNILIFATLYHVQSNPLIRLVGLSLQSCVQFYFQCIHRALSVEVQASPSCTSWYHSMHYWYHTMHYWYHIMYKLVPHHAQAGTTACTPDITTWKTTRPISHPSVTFHEHTPCNAEMSKERSAKKIARIKAGVTRTATWQINGSMP